MKGCIIMSNKRIIWSNDFEVDDWKDYFTELYPDKDWETLDYSEKYDIISEANSEYLNDERRNLDIQLNNPILVIANLGLWNGRRSAYKIIKSGNISDILYSDCDYNEWFADTHNVRCIASHHDGTNYYLYREIKPDVNIDNLLNKIYNGENITSQMLSHYTKSIRPYVASVYGW